MAWQTVQHRRGPRKAGAEGDTAVEALARELRAALMPRPRQRPFRPEWTCPQCRRTNWMDRSKCRVCGQVQAGVSPAQTAPGPGPPISVAPRMPRPWGPAKTLGAVAQAAAAAGASEEALAALRQDVEGQREERRSAGGRLDAARAKAARASREAAQARAAADAAEARAAAAEAAAERAQEELVGVERALAPAPSGQGRADELLLQRTKALLQQLETGAFAATTDLPPTVIAAMTAVHEVVSQIAPPKTGAVGEPLESAAEGPSDAEEAEHRQSEDDAMDELDGLSDDDDDQALLAAARRLRKARKDARPSPHGVRSKIAKLR